MHYDGTLPIEKRDDGEYEFEFRHVSFRYPQQKNDVLHDVNIRFHVKEKLAIVGMNGAGKTTIVKLLCRLYDPSEGEILLNGINIQKYDYAEYTSIFSVVFQDFALFSYPLDENVAGASTPNDKRIASVLQRLDIWERIKSFTYQENSLLFTNYANGVNVSGGEAQKLAIARALYKDAPFVILDEPTAALDPLSEAEIYEHFDMLVKGKTTLYISHRMSSCKFCDRIIVMKQGKVEEEGTHDTLLKENGVYAQLWNAQAQYYSE
jgi:ATP-binding cassette subfamily B protein